MLVSVPLGRALRHYQVTVEPVSAMVACAGLAGYFTLMLSQTLGPPSTCSMSAATWT